MLATEVQFRRPDASYIDFLEGFKVWSNKTMLEYQTPAFEKLAADYQARTGKPVDDLETVAEIMEPSQPYRWYTWSFRKAQEMMWQSCIWGIEPYRAEWEADLANPNKPGSLGKLILHPEIPVPRWSTVHEIHLQPGGFHGDPLAGPVYELGARIHNLRKNDDNAHQHLIASVPPDGDYERILDFGCGTGRSTVPFKQRFPNAEVWGIEISEPLCRYAHARAESMGYAVNFEQMNSAEMLFPDDHFDIVSSHIVFHEMPPHEVKKTMREAFRVLKPGGLFVTSDLAPFADQGPLREFLTRWQDKNNGEPFSNLWMELDVPGELESIGFIEIDAGGRWDPRRGRPFPYIYTARKPAI